MSFSFRFDKYNDKIMLSFDGVDKEIGLDVKDLDLIIESYKKANLENCIEEIEMRINAYSKENKDNTSIKKKSFIKMDLITGPTVVELDWDYTYLLKDNVFDSKEIAAEFLDKNYDDIYKLFFLLKEENK